MAIRKNRLSAVYFSLILLANPCFCFAAKSGTPTPPITVKTQVDKNSVSIGDKVKYSICILADKGIEVEFPVFQENLGDFAVKDFGKSTRTFFSRKTIIQWYLLDTYITGKYTLPKPVIKYRHYKDKEWNQIEGSQLEVEVKSLLDKSDAHLAIRDIKAPVNLPVKWLKFFILGGIVLIIFGGVLAYGYFRKKKVILENAFKRPAHEIAFEQLEALRNKDYISKGQVKEYYSEISMIIRYYLENRFSLRAPEMTTEEFLAHVRDYSPLADEHKALLKEFLSRCDMVKFAKYAPSKEEIESVFDSAKNFIEQTKDELP
ncbi:MAG: hypothetical protein NT033_02300 [Candidatus Omnitrophica bacterium]|nr:hypothetical protein [Candidatus Omnitrophota bacterium]